MPTDVGEESSPPAGPSKPPTPRERLTRGAKGIWQKSGLNVKLLIAMFKGGIPPAVIIAMYQTRAISSLFPTDGYILGIVALLGMCNLPRAKFLQTLVLDVFVILVGTCLTLLATYCSVRARESSSPSLKPGEKPPYNPSASAVLGVFFFFEIYMANVVRSKYPQFTFPIVLFSVFADVSAVLTVHLPDTHAAIKFSVGLMELFLLGFGVATGVHFLVFPTDMRSIIFGKFNAYFAQLRVALNAQLDYINSLEDTANVKRGIGSAETVRQARTAQAKAAKGSIAALQGTHGALNADMAFAKREVGFGYLGPEHLNEMSKLNNKTILPVIGLGAIIDIFEEIHALNNIIGAAVDSGDPKETEDELRARVTNDWADYMQELHDTHGGYVRTIEEGIEHVLLVLRLKKGSREKPIGTEVQEGDTEHDAGDSSPGSEKFIEYYEAKVERLHEDRKVVLRLWCERKGIALSEEFFDHPTTAAFAPAPETGDAKNERLRFRRKQRELFMLFYLEYLLYAAARAVFRYISYADNLRNSGIMSKRRLIYPGRKRMRKWLLSIFTSNDTTNEEERVDLTGSVKGINPDIVQGMRRDPEHLPPSNVVEHIGNHVRRIPRLLRSPESAFAFRMACAAMSVAIVAFLHQTQDFFDRERGQWCLIVISITMNPTAGASLFFMGMRALGTVLAVLLGWLAWYIPDQHTAGVLVFLWFFTGCLQYIPLKKPQFTSVGFVSMIALSLIIGYELEVREVGPVVASSTGQPYYPIVQYAPRRLLNALIGIGVTFFWSIFPFPISEHSKIRRLLADSLCHLADYHTIVHEEIHVRLRTKQEDDNTGPLAHLEKQRSELFSKLTMALNNLRALSYTIKYEIPVGGRFPKEVYDRMTVSVSSLLSFISLVGYAAKSLGSSADSGSAWSEEFHRAFDSAVVTSKETTVLLTLLSNSIANGNPLPPYLRPPQPYRLSQEIEALSKDLFGIRYLSEPSYEAFAAIQVSMTCIIKELDDLLADVKGLVGELDFSDRFASALGKPKSSRGSDTTDAASARTKVE